MGYGLGYGIGMGLWALGGDGVGLGWDWVLGDGIWAASISIHTRKREPLKVRSSLLIFLVKLWTD